MFEAWTKPELLVQWLLPPNGWTARSKSDLRVGGKYYHEMIAGSQPIEAGSCAEQSNLQPGGVKVHEGEYLEITPPERLVFTWNAGAVQNTRVTVELRDMGDSTELWLTHELFETEEQRRSHDGGWLACLEQLEHVLTA